MSSKASIHKQWKSQKFQFDAAKTGTKCLPTTTTFPHPHPFYNIDQIPNSPHLLPPPIL